MSTAAWNSAATRSASVTSVRTNRPPTSSAAALPAASSRSASTTCAPSAANRRAVAIPIPPVPPVMTATRPARRSVISLLFITRLCCVDGDGYKAMKMFLVSVKAASASGPSSRPRPDCLKPPKGVE